MSVLQKPCHASMQWKLRNDSIRAPTDIRPILKSYNVQWNVDDVAAATGVCSSRYERGREKNMRIGI